MLFGLLTASLKETISFSIKLKSTAENILQHSVLITSCLKFLTTKLRQLHDGKISRSATPY